MMEAGDECEDVSGDAVKETSEELDATESGVAAEENDSFGSLQSEVFNIDNQSAELTSLNGDEVTKEAGKVVKALIMSFGEEGASADEWYGNPGDTVDDNKATEEKENQELLENKHTSCQNVNFCENECQSIVCKMEESFSSGNHPEKASLQMEKPDKFRPNSVDVDTHSTNSVNIDKSKNGSTLSVSDTEKERLSTLDRDIIHGYDCNQEALPDPFVDVKGDILEALPHLDDDEVKALVDTVYNMEEKTEARTDTLIIKGWGEIDEGKKENFEALTEEGLYEAGFVTISPLACGVQCEGSEISAGLSGNISEAEQSFLKSAVLALDTEKIEVDLNLHNPVHDPGCSGGEYESLPSKFTSPVKARGESQLGDAWRPTAEEAAAALADSSAHSAHRGQHAVNCVDAKCKMDAEGEGMVDNKVKGGELKEWLLVKEREFDEILGHGEENDHVCKNAQEMDGQIPQDGFVKACEIEVMAGEMSPANTVTEVRPDAKDISSEGSAASMFVTETTTDLMDELELQSEILRQITAKATVVSADYVIGETIKGSEEHDGEIQMKKGKTIKVGSKSMKAKKKIPKSPLLKRSEIKACIDLHNACENADILQEIIHPAICFGSSHEATCSLEQGTTIKEVESKKEVDEPVFVEEVTWQDPPQPRPRKPVFAGKPRWQPIRVAGLALNQFSHFSGCHVNVSQDTSCATAFIHAAIAGVLVYYQSLIPTTYKDIDMILYAGCGCSLLNSWNGLVPLENPLPPPPHWHCGHHQPGYGEEWRQFQGVKHWPVPVGPGSI